MPEAEVTVVGGGLAGCEAAYQLARRGVTVELADMKPLRRSPAHRSDFLGELVCSNSLRSDLPETAMGLLHRELRALGSLVLAAADACRVPAGDALAVDRERFAAYVTEAVERHPRIRRTPREVTELPGAERLAIIATGPLTADALARQIGEVCGGRLFFYDAIAPIVAADSIDLSVAFFASRFGQGNGEDYLNLPLTREQYDAFVDELLGAEKVAPHAFEEARYFDGCLPIEVMAERGRQCLAFGPLKPIGLTDPRTGKRPFAVVQLRAEDLGRTAWNMVGFQTRLTYPEQRRVFRMLPGLGQAEFLRLGQIHRNTFIESPRLLASDLSLRARPHLLFAGQITGVEGYVESASCGLLAALSAQARLAGRPFAPPPPETALGALLRHVTGEAHAPGLPYQPSHLTFALFAPLAESVRKNERRAALSRRAQERFAEWVSGTDGPLSCLQDQARAGSGTL